MQRTNNNSKKAAADPSNDSPTQSPTAASTAADLVSPGKSRSGFFPSRPLLSCAVQARVFNLNRRDDSPPPPPSCH